MTIDAFAGETHVGVVAEEALPFVRPEIAIEGDTVLRLVCISPLATSQVSTALEMNRRIIIRTDKDWDDMIFRHIIRQFILVEYMFESLHICLIGVVGMIDL